MSKCKFCGSSSFGSCSKSPHKKHEHGDMDEKNVFSAVLLLTALVARAHTESTNMGVAPINASIVGLPVQVLVARARMESMKNNRT